MNGSQLVSAYTQIANNDLFPVLSMTDSGVDPTMALFYVNLGAERVMRLLAIEAKDTFNFTSGTPSYAIETATSTRFYQINRVQVAGSDLTKTSINDTYGWYVIDGTIYFNQDNPTNTVITLYGQKYAPAIVSDTNEITGIHKSCHLAIAMLGIVESAVAQEDDPQQLERIARMEATAEDMCQRRRNVLAMSSFPTSLTDGSK